MAVSGKVTSAGIAGPGSSTDYAVALWNGTLGDTLRTQANLLVESGLVKVRQSGGVGGVDEMQFSHDGSNAKIETLDGDLLIRTPLNKAVRIRPAPTSASNYLFVCEDASGTGRMIFDLLAYRLYIGGASGVQIDGVTGDLTLISASSDVRASGFANFKVTNPRIRWPTFSPDVQLDRIASGELQIFDSTTGRGSLRLLNLLSTGYIELTEISAPSNPAANGARVLARDNGAGKTEIYALFADGSEDSIALQP